MISDAVEAASRTIAGDARQDRGHGAGDLERLPARRPVRRVRPDDRDLVRSTIPIRTVTTMFHHRIDYRFRLARNGRPRTSRRSTGMSA
jgi:hypothetical protein